MNAEPKLVACLSPAGNTAPNRLTRFLYTATAVVIFASLAAILVLFLLVMSLFCSAPLRRSGTSSAK